MISRRFEEVALEVLAEDDPAYELPPEERWRASFHKKVPRYSQALRNGLADTLAFLGARPERLTGCTWHSRPGHARLYGSFWTVRSGSAGLRSRISCLFWPRPAPRRSLRPSDRDLRASRACPA